ncbi:pre-mRNA-splicing factor 38B-like isoform X2 [Halichondria panicea]|uniref:pre-mRNA-splicing factor 38B-like isoform X2 n=1 Tax=Halichondria panicea TaxID=6063 RepID=UPI00312BC404
MMARSSRTLCPCMEELIQFKTFHEVIDEIYYKVEHMEPWEKNSRKLAGQVGMCAGVRGVAAGGIVSTAFCLLFKLFTLKLTRKQVNVMLNHPDSPYIRAIGFLYVRYCQPPADFWSWFYPFLEDEEEINLKAGGGYNVTIGEMCRLILTSLDWFGTLFPRMPVHVQKDLIKRLEAIPPPTRAAREPVVEVEPEVKNGHGHDGARDQWGEAARRIRAEGDSKSPRRSRERRDRSPEKRSRSRDRQRSRSRDRKRNRSTSRDKKNRSRSRDKRRSRSRDRHHHRSNSRERRRSRSHDRRKGRSRSNDRGSRRRSRSHEKRGRSRSPEKRSRSKDRRRR